MSLREVSNTCSTWRFKARMTPIRANIASRDGYAPFVAAFIQGLKDTGANTSAFGTLYGPAAFRKRACAWIYSSVAEDESHVRLVTALVGFRANADLECGSSRATGCE
jgi:hypothetical protein